MHIEMVGRFSVIWIIRLDLDTCLFCADLVAAIGKRTAIGIEERRILPSVHVSSGEQTLQYYHNIWNNCVSATESGPE